MLLAQRIDKDYRSSRYWFYVGSVTGNEYLEGNASNFHSTGFSLYLTRFCVLKTLE